MQKGEMMIAEREEIETQKSQIEYIQKLKKKLNNKDKKLKVLRSETRNLIAELDYAYKTIRKTQEELIVKEKLNIAGEIAAGVAHELRNSLNIIGISVQYLHNKFNPRDENRRFTETIMNKVEKLNFVATDLIHFARPHINQFKKYDIHNILDHTLSLVKFKCIVQKVKVERNYAFNLPLVEVDSELIKQLVLNLIDNALWAMPEGGKLVVTTSILPKNDFVQIKITDTGCGISKTDIPCIYNPFFTRKENGIGFGLAIVHRIIEEHKGTINVESELNDGTVFMVKLPVSQKK